MSKVLILGGLGLIGSSIAADLSKDNEVTIVDNKKLKVNLPTNIEFIQLDVFRDGTLFSIFKDKKPNIIINAINVATLFSRDPENNFKKIIKFYQNLYKTLESSNDVKKYIQFGTTGSGGLGFDIPFTHGDKSDDLPIINKAAFAGISTAMLTLLSRSYEGRITISEIKPGLAIFKNDIERSKYKGSNLVLIDGGESGDYTYNELALLTCYMGYTTVEKIVDRAKDVIDNNKKWHFHCVSDTVESINKAIINSTKVDLRNLKIVLRKMKKYSGDNYIIATGNLGPPPITKNLIFAYIKSRNVDNEKDFKETISAPIIHNTLDYIKTIKQDLYQYLNKELTYSNFSAQPITNSEPWESVRDLLSKNARSN